MSKTLIAYFSVSGMTKRVARMLAEVKNADLYEIVPETAYTTQDLDWTNKASRSTIEMLDKSCRPAISGEIPDLAGFDTVYVGFPVWWGREPSIVDTFLDAADFSGKTVIPFCTSGGSGVDGAVARFTELLGSKACVGTGIRIPANVSEEEIAELCK